MLFRSIKRYGIAPGAIYRRIPSKPSSTPAGSLAESSACRTSWVMWVNTVRRAPKWGYALVGTLALLLVAGEVAGTWKALTFLGRFGDIGLNVFSRVLEIGLITLSSGVTFSATTAAISTLYLSDDLNFLLTQPIQTTRVFALKVTETFLNAALVPVFLTVQLLLTVAAYFHAPVWAYPVMLLTALAIRLDSPGPMLFRQKRCGVVMSPSLFVINTATPAM